MQDLQENREAARLGSPWMWTTYPYVRVERRTHQRPGQPFCLVMVDETGWVVPTVFFVQTFPPKEFEPEEAFGFAYVDLEALAADGWRIVSGTE